MSDNSEGYRRQLVENADLFKSAQLQYAQAQEQREATAVQQKINRLLKKRRELYELLRENPPADDVLKLDGTGISANDVLVGNLAISAERAGPPDPQAEPRYCERCGGLINHREVYPSLHLHAYELSSAGCRCP